ncbi:hypothetical protein HYH02_006876 [Chlamydomonas schloesseri]|uniref:Uncharacterized protein n=1 Tax=Chlamydomonas schloesseri TaxID=2026947 RepID=A0A835WJ20_9CHLO|nr:hypothetical protein HYH02_006876 [Chlamydomonas schloesseri]|eukprot:KAG2448292.1 hypothetical protein HYH02_006876 [Chlamydomonas schloesseri]
MGVNGLTRLLEEGGRPRVVTFAAGQGAGQVVVVDASAVEYHLLGRIRDDVHTNWREPGTFHRRLYADVCRYLGGLLRAGLRLVLVLDSASAPGAEMTAAARRREALAAGFFKPPTAEMVVLQAYQDLSRQLPGLTIRRSRHGADALVAAEAAAAAAPGQQLLAVLTDDSDFYVLGGACAPRLIHSTGVVVDTAAASVTLQVWDTRQLWQALAKAAVVSRGSAAAASTGPPAAEPSLLRRAQVAAVLGNDYSQDVRRRLQMRRGAVLGARGGGGRGGGGRSGGYAAGPSEVAREVLRLPPGAAPDLEFFRQPSVGLKSFGPEDLEAYDAVVQSYMDEYAAAIDGSAARLLTLRSPLQPANDAVAAAANGAHAVAAAAAAADADAVAAALPWIHPQLAARIAAADPVPPQLASLACRGLSTFTLPPEYCRALQHLRRGVTEALLGATAVAADAPAAAVGHGGGGGRCAYEYLAAEDALHVLVAGGGAGGGGGGEQAAGAEDCWFDPAAMPGVPVRGGSGSVQAAGAASAAPPVPQRQATLAETASAVAEAAAAAAGPAAPAVAAPGGAMLPPALAMYYALLLHAADPDPAAWQLQEVRDFLLPGVPLPVELLAAEAAEALAAVAEGAGDADADAEAGAELGPELAAALRAGSNVIDVGSALTGEDWEDIDAKDVVNRVRGGAGFALMGRIRPWQPAPLPLPQPQPGAIAPAGIDAAATARADARDAQRLVALARAALDAGAGGPLWARMNAAWAAARAEVRQQALCDVWSSANKPSPSATAVAAPPPAGSTHAAGQQQQAVAAAAAAPMRYRHQQQLLDLIDEHLTLAAQGAAGGVVAQHQPQLQAAGVGQEEYLLQAAPGTRLSVILSTPTGSGKTFTAVMLQLHVLRAQQARAAQGGGGAGAVAPDAGVVEEARTGHPRTILIYSVPTKQVLKRVGQECEAHRIVYWTAASVGEVFQVRRPYSIRTRKDTTKRDARVASGPMQEQLMECERKGVQLCDRGGGVPEVIIADIRATAALLAEAHACRSTSFFHWRRLVLYLDEPNMGLHLDPQLRHVVQRVMSHAPLTTVLASATLPHWDQLPAWWRGPPGVGAAVSTTRLVITQEPYELPVCRLAVLDAAAGQVVPLSPLDLFADAAEAAQLLTAHPRARVLLLRHFSPQQANRLLGLGGGGGGGGGGRGRGGGAGDHTPAEAGDEDRPGDGADEEGAEDWEVLGEHVGDLRSERLEPALMQLLGQPERFETLRAEWRAADRPAAAPRGLADALSKTAVTLIATLEPRRLALQLARESLGGEQAWAAKAKELRAKIREAVAAKRRAERERERQVSRGVGAAAAAEAGGRAAAAIDRSGDAGSVGRVSLRPGVVVDAEDAESGAQDDDTLVMLSQGIAYTSSGNVEPIVKSQYQQALLYAPDRSGVRPALHTLVVDYSAAYGTDAPAVDTLVLRPDLAALLSPADHQQLMGRLRRDGAAVYPDYDTLRAAVLGLGRRELTARRGARQAAFRGRVLEALAPHVGEAEGQQGAGAGPATAGAGVAAAAKAVVTQLRSVAVPGVFGRHEVAAVVLQAALCSLVVPLPELQAAAAAGVPGSPVPAAAQLAAATDSQLLAAKGRLRRWGNLQPLGLLAGLELKGPGEQRRLVEALAELCSGGSGGLAGAAGAGGAGEGADLDARLQRLSKFAKLVLVTLADEDVVEFEGLQQWLSQLTRGGDQRPKAGAAAELGAAQPPPAFVRAVREVAEWLEESSEDEEDEGV